MKLPQISGIGLVKLMTKKGFMIVRQRGSHIRLQKIAAKNLASFTDILNLLKQNSKFIGKIRGSTLAPLM